MLLLNDNSQIRKEAIITLSRYETKPPFDPCYTALIGKASTLAAIDACEPQIIRALEKDGWRLEKKPYPIETGTRSLYADCVFERINNGISEQIIIVEVKCFTHETNDLPEIYTTIGQYAVYRAALEAEGATLPLFLAIPDNAYRRLTRDSAIRLALEKMQMRFVIVNLENEVVVSWKT